MKEALGIAAVMAAVIIPGIGHADSETSTVQVFLTLVASCSIDSAANLDFGSLSEDQVAAGTQTASSDIQVTCSNGTTYDIGLSGTNGARAMQSVNGSTVEYRLFQDAGNSIDWDSSSVVSGVGHSTAVTHTVNGLLPGGIALDAMDSINEGISLSDEVIVTLTF